MSIVDRQHPARLTERAIVNGREFEDVLYWQFGTDFVPYYEAQWDAQGDRLSYEKVWGAW